HPLRKKRCSLCEGRGALGGIPLGLVMRGALADTLRLVKWLPARTSTVHNWKLNNVPDIFLGSAVLAASDEGCARAAGVLGTRIPGRVDERREQPNEAARADPYRTALRATGREDCSGHDACGCVDE